MGQLVFSDVHWILTGSKINIGQDGEIFKSFDVKGGCGIVQWEEQDGHDFVIVTSREPHAVANRASELDVDEVHRGEKIEEIAPRFGLDLADTICIGDDLTDLQAMKAVGTACCPTDAAQEVKKECSYVSQFNGGDGAV